MQSPDRMVVEAVRDKLKASHSILRSAASNLSDAAASWQKSKDLNGLTKEQETERQRVIAERKQEVVDAELAVKSWEEALDSVLDRVVGD